jgi:hypothetical protein
MQRGVPVRRYGETAGVQDAPSQPTEAKLAPDLSFASYDLCSGK